MAATAGNDTIYGKIGPDNISGLGGDDFIFGYDGDDTLNGGAGDDFLSGEEGQDYLIGGLGSDSFIAGGDTCEGGAGTDYIGADMFGLGSTTFLSIEVFVAIGDKSSLKVEQVGLFEFIQGDSGSTDLAEIYLSNGGEASFRGRTPQGVIAHASNFGNTIRGDTGDDKLLSGPRSDLLFGNAGNDTLGASFNISDSYRDTIYGGIGDDQIISWDAQKNLYGGAGNDRFILRV